MADLDEKDGICRLCGFQGRLSYEHIPPERAFNERPVILHKWQEFESGAGGEYLARGRGGYTLCGRCNNNTGGDYGSAFVEWCYYGFQLLEHTLGKHSQNYHGQIYPLQVIKQIATIFFSVNGPQFREKHPCLVRFVRDRHTTGLPPDYSFFVFWYGGGQVRQSGVTGAADLVRNQINILSEFVHPPFGYVLSLSGRLFDRRPEDISWFARYNYGEAITLNLRLPVLPTNWMLPGDYRTEEQINRDAQINDLEARGVLNAEEIVDRRERSF